MTRHFAEQGVEMCRCRRCDHDLYVVRHGSNQGQIRCSNQTCKFATEPYKMGKNHNPGRAIP